MFVNTKHELEEAFSKYNILDIFDTSETVCELLVEGEPKKKSLQSNPVVYAWTTSFGRIYIHRWLTKLCQAGFRPLLTDTDQIIFSGPTTTPVPLDIGHCVGDFKPDLGYFAKLISYHAMGRKNWGLQYLSEDGHSHILSKVRGLRLNSEAIQKYLSKEQFMTYLQKHLDGEKVETKVPQSRVLVDGERSGVQEKIVYIKYTNNTSFERVLNTEDMVYASTTPYGYYQVQK